MPHKFEPERSDIPFDVWERMSPAERSRVISELTNRVRRRIWESICEEHPDWPNWEKKIEFMRVIFDPEPLPRGFEEMVRERRDEIPPAF